MLRIRLDSKLTHEDKPKPVYIIHNGGDKLVSAQYFQDDLTDYWLDYLNVHYEFDENWKDKIRKEFDELKNKPLTNCTLWELHRMVKYHKDVNTTFPNSILFIKKIRLEVASRLENAKNEGNIFNIYNLSIDLNYIINNEFSLICDEKNTNVTIDEVQSLYEEIKTLEVNTGIKNFFPQTKYVKFLLLSLKKTYKDKEALGSIQKCITLIDRCLELYKEYEENINWSKNNYPYVFQLPLTDCFNKISRTERLFVFSSFLLPLTKEKYIDELTNYKLEIAQLDASIRVLDNIDKHITGLAETKKEFDDDVAAMKLDVEEISRNAKDREFRAIEIIGIFTAIISFVAASLPTFKFINTPLDAAMYMLALATSFSVFVLLLLLAFRGVEKAKEYKKIIIGGFIIVLILWTVIILISEPFNKKDNSSKGANGNKNSISNIIVSPTDINNQYVPIPANKSLKKESLLKPTRHDTVFKLVTPCPRNPY